MYQRKARASGERRVSVPTLASRAVESVASAPRCVSAELAQVLGKESYAHPAAFQDLNCPTGDGFSH